MDSSVGANAVRAIRSQPMQNTAPPRKAAGMTTTGLDVFSPRRTKCGTAMPTNEIGPANAVTHADSTLDSTISATRNARILTPRLRA